MIVADSGSTKCDWLIMDPNTGKVTQEVSTMGFNPFFHTVSHILDALNDSSELVKRSREATNVHYFGAGCSSPERRKVVYDALAKFFFNAKSVQVDHDLIGAAYATCDGKPGIACILGTGSNMCYFDGEVVVNESTALGFILGDEGSGSYMGKQLLRDFLYDDLPSQIKKELVEEFGLSREVVFHNVYSRPFANVYLASFAPFLSRHRHYYYVRKLVRKSLIDFLDTHVITDEHYEEVPVHFVGSIAFFYEDILREVCTRKGIQTGNIVQQPVHNIAAYLLKTRPTAVEA